MDISVCGPRPQPLDPHQQKAQTLGGLEFAALDLRSGLPGPQISALPPHPQGALSPVGPRCAASDLSPVPVLTSGSESSTLPFYFTSGTSVVPQST